MASRSAGGDRRGGIGGGAGRPGDGTLLDGDGE